MFINLLLFHSQGIFYCHRENEDMMEWKSKCSQSCGFQKQFSETPKSWSFLAGDKICFPRDSSTKIIIPDENVEIIIGTNTNLTVSKVLNVEKDQNNNTLLNGKVLVTLKDNQTSILTIEHEINQFSQPNNQTQNNNNNNDNNNNNKRRLNAYVNLCPDYSIPLDTTVCYRDGTLLYLSYSYPRSMDDYENYPPWAPYKFDRAIVSGTNRIGKNAFRECIYLKTLEINSGIQTIYSHAFHGCTSLTSISISSADLLSIQEYAFCNCSSLENYTIPSSVETIGNYIFSGCSKLTTIVFSDSIALISEHAFNYCIKLTDITFPSSLTNIANYAFYHCTELTSFTIPDTVETIGEYVFSECTKLNSINFGTGISIIERYDFSSTKLTNLIIPDTISQICEGAFSNCYELISVIFGENLELVLGNSIFENCLRLTDIQISPKLLSQTLDLVFPVPRTIKSINISGGTTIGDYTFRNFYELTTIIIPNSITKIGEGSFYSCSALESISIPESVTEIGENAFSKCINLKTIIVSSDNTKFASENGILYSKSLEILYKYPEGKEDNSFTFPTDTKIIASFSFYSVIKLTSITIPNTITTIQYSAFVHCIGLTSITIPNSVITIGNNIFDSCYSITTITLSGSILQTEISNKFSSYRTIQKVIISEGTTITSIGNNAFKNFVKLNQITIPNSILSIGEGAFSYCYQLTNIQLPNQINKISNHLFEYCTELSSIEIPSSVTTIGEYAFSHCNKLKLGITSFDIPNTMLTIDKYAFSYCTGITTIKIPSSLETLGDYSFSYCSELTKVEFEDSISTKHISEMNSFIGCTKLNEIIFLQNNEDFTIKNLIIFSKNYQILYFYPKWKTDSSYIIENTVKTIGDYAFSECLNLLSITIPESVISIGKSAFENCQQITSFSFPNSIETIGESAFSHCIKLDCIIIPSKITTIQSNTFSYCEVLSLLTFSNQITTIKDYAFYHCSSLSSIKLLTGVITIKNYVFGECQALKTIEIPNTVTEIGTHVFYYCSNLEIIEIPNTLGFTTIKSHLFYYCTKLSNLTIPNSVTSIESFAFYNCISLTNLIIPNNVETIGENAFQKSGLKQLTIPSKVTIINDFTFSDCSSLSKIIISNGITTIGNYVFSNCNKLKSIEFPQSITSFGTNSFKDSSLKCITYKGTTIINEGSLSSTNVVFVTSDYLSDNFMGKTLQLFSDKIILTPTDSSCIARCDSNKGYGGDPNDCELCTESNSYAKIDGSYCTTSCENNFVNIDKTHCVSECGPEEMYDRYKNCVNQCESNELLTSDRKKCIDSSQCSDNAEIIDGICSCKKGYFGDGTICDSCSGYLSINETICYSECPEGYFISGNYCNDSCEFVDDSGKNCLESCSNENDNIIIIEDNSVKYCTSQDHIYTLFCQDPTSSDCNYDLIPTNSHVQKYSSCIDDTCKPYENTTVVILMYTFISQNLEIEIPRIQSENTIIFEKDPNNDEQYLESEMKNLMVSGDNLILYTEEDQIYVSATNTKFTVNSTKTIVLIVSKSLIVDHDYLGDIGRIFVPVIFNESEISITITDKINFDVLSLNVLSDEKLTKLTILLEYNVYWIQDIRYFMTINLKIPVKIKSTLISFEENYDPFSNQNTNSYFGTDKKKLGANKIAGIVVGCLLFIIFAGLILIIVYTKIKSRPSSEE